MSNGLLDHIYNERWHQTIKRVAAHPYEAQYRIYGSTALHWACSRRATIDVVKAIVAAFPKATCVQDNNGWTPLHLASSKAFSSSGEIVHFLLQTNMNALLLKDRFGRSPLHFMCWAYEINILQVVNEAYNFNSESLGMLHEIFPASRKCSFWRKACLMVNALVNGTVGITETAMKSTPSIVENELYAISRVLHTLIQMGDGCPSILLQLALKLHPDQMYEIDEKGNFPLHVAAASCHDEFFRIVSMAYAGRPITAQTRNHEGMIPLFLALQSGKKWEDGVGGILDAFPGAVLLVDCKSGLSPFMTAAVGETACLTSTYCLLRSCPELRMMQ